LSGSAGFPGYTVWKQDLGTQWFKFPDDGKTVLFSSDSTNGADGTWSTAYVISCMERADIDLGLGAAYPVWVITSETNWLLQANGTSAIYFNPIYTYTKQ
jgi:hypothetical protein